MTTILTATMDNTQAGWATYTIRNTIHSDFVLASASSIKVKFTAYGTNLGIGECWIGHRDSDPDKQNFDGNQVKVTFGGSDSTIITSGNSEWSDTIVVDIDADTELIISTYITAGYNTVCYDLQPTPPDSGVRVWYVSGNHAGDTLFDGSGYTADAIYMVEQIDEPEIVALTASDLSHGHTLDDGITLSDPNSSVSFWFLDQLNEQISEPIRVFTLAGSDHSSNVISWPKIRKKITDFKFKTANISLENVDGLYNEFIESIYTIPATCTLDIGFTHPESGDELLRLYTGYVERLSFVNQKVTFQLRDIAFKLSLIKIGSDENPVIMSDTNPAEVAWTLCTCYGGLSSVENSSNPDIDYSYYTTWYNENQVNGTTVDVYYDGSKIITNLKDLCEYTDSYAWIDNNGKIIFDRLSEVSSLNYVIGEGDYISAGIDVDLSKLTNRQYVNYNYSVDSDMYGNQAVAQNTSSVNSYGAHEKIISKNTVWFDSEVQALVVAQRKILRGSTPSKEFIVKSPLRGIHRLPGTNVRLINSFYNVDSSTAWTILEQEINMDNFSTMVRTSEELTLPGFYLDISNLDGDDRLL